MNMVFGSEVALLGFWEYMFRILLAPIAGLKLPTLDSFSVLQIRLCWKRPFINENRKALFLPVSVNTVLFHTPV